MCQNVTMTSHHVFECSILPTLWASGASITCHMALRMFTQKNLEYFKEIKSSLKQVNQIYLNIENIRWGKTNMHFHKVIKKHSKNILEMQVLN